MPSLPSCLPSPSPDASKAAMPSPTLQPAPAATSNPIPTPAPQSRLHALPRELLQSILAALLDSWVPHFAALEIDTALLIPLAFFGQPIASSAQAMLAAYPDLHDDMLWALERARARIDGQIASLDLHIKSEDEKHQFSAEEREWRWRARCKGEEGERAAAVYGQHRKDIQEMCLLKTVRSGLVRIRGVMMLMPGEEWGPEAMGKTVRAQEEKEVQIVSARAATLQALVSASFPGLRPAPLAY